MTTMREHCITVESRIQNALKDHFQNPEFKLTTTAEKWDVSYQRLRDAFWAAQLAASAQQPTPI